jgi:hypothetical protein
LKESFQPYGPVKEGVTTAIKQYVYNIYGHRFVHIEDPQKYLRITAYPVSPKQYRAPLAEKTMATREKQAGDGQGADTQPRPL